MSCWQGFDAKGGQETFLYEVEVIVEMRHEERLYSYYFFQAQG